MAVVSINSRWCKGCGICVAFCPKNTLVLDQEDKAFQIRPDDCVGCGMCALYCPDLAVTIDVSPIKGQSSQQEVQT